MAKQNRNYVLPQLLLVSSIILFIVTPLFSAAPVGGSGNCLSFDGINDYVSVTSNGVTNPGMTLEFWIKPNDPQRLARIFTQGVDANASRQISARWNNRKVQFYTSINGSDGTPQISSQAITDDNATWTHVAWTYDGSTHKVYINGRDSSESVLLGTVNVNHGMTIGEYNSDPDYYFSGSLDEFRLWNVLRTQTEIQENMYRTFDSSSTDANDLIIYFRFDETSGTSALDYSDTQTNGTVSGANWVASEAWKNRSTSDSTPLVICAGYDLDNDSLFLSTSVAATKGRLSFEHEAAELVYVPDLDASGVDNFTYQIGDGTNTDTYAMSITITNTNVAPVAGSGLCLDLDSSSFEYARVPHTSILAPANVITVEFWAYTEDWTHSNNEDRSIVSKLQIGGYAIAQNPSKIYARLYRNSDYGDVEFPTSGLSSGWHHFALVYDSRFTMLYIDADLKDTDDAGSNYLIGYTYNNALILGGEAGESYKAVDDFEGRLDEVRIWNSVRTQPELKANMYKALAGNETNLIGYWRFDETDGNIIHDYSIFHNDAILINTESNDWVESSAWQNRTIGNQFTHSAGYDPDVINLTSITEITAPTHGTLSFNITERTVTYTATGGYLGPDTYTYQVSDGSLTDTFVMNVTVTENAAPSFTVHPQSDTVYLNSSSTFIAAASGYPLPSYNWQKLISSTWTDLGDTDSIYTIASIAFTDSGNYRVLANNSEGADTSDVAYLWVQDTIIISSQPQNDTVLVGNTASFNITANGGEITYQWQRNDGGWHNVAAGGTSAAYSFASVSGDNGVYFRCVVTSSSKSKTSDSALLIIESSPTIATSFSSDTAMAVGGNLSLAASATGLPSPTYEWFFISPASPTPVSKGNGTIFNLSNAIKADSGTYYYVASNKHGSTSSDSIFIHVLTAAGISVDIPSSYNVINGGTAILRPQSSGDGLFSYQWYKNTGALSGEIGDSLAIGPVDSAQHDGNTYYVQVSNHLHGVTIGTANSTTCTLHVSQFYNPFKIRVQRISTNNTSQVRVSLWSDVSITDFPTTEPVLIPSPWADSIWVLYQTNSYASSEDTASVARFSTQEIKQAAPNPVEHTLTVGNLPLPHDSCFWFNYSIKWHNPDTLLRPFIPAEKVFMLDTIAGPNPLVVHGEYVMKTDTAKIHLDSIAKLDSVRDSGVVILASRFPVFDPLLLNDTLSVNELSGSGNRHTIILDNIGSLPLETDTMYCRWYVFGKNLTLSSMLDTTVIIGWDRPVYTGILQADSTFMGDQIHLAWTAPPSGIDSIRIWWDQSPIPLIHNPNLPQAQAFYPSSTLILTDTLKNVLTNNTVYYVGLQIFKDDMWSRITAQASDTVKTAVGNTDTVANSISIDSAGFNSVTNSMTIYWHIDLSVIPSGSYLQMGYTYEPGLSLDTTHKPLLWDSISTSSNVAAIPITDIIFDSTYTVGLWLRANHITQGPTKPSSPTDSSKISINTPAFTWQAVTFFPDTSIVYAANNKIILQELTPFVHHDTLWSYDPGTLDSGFVSVGGVSFTFNNKTPGIAPFALGLTYDSLTSGIDTTDLAMYQIINNEYHVFHDFEVKDSAVWVTITNTDMAYPFIILADTSEPQLIVSPYKDTITKTDDYPLLFKIKDNCANTQWTYTYGSGNQGYTYSSQGYLTSSHDTGLIPVEMDTLVINESFGVRALLIASDGPHQDTINVSRCVKNTKGEVFSITAHQWAPLRTTGGLNEPTLDKIFTKSIMSGETWKYDNKQVRLFRWYNLDSREKNKWLEYGDSIKTEFNFIPGQPIWCKTAQSHAISFGSGVTTTLKESYKIKLKPKNYTDITLPFQFPVKLKDILIASAPYSDSIDVYQWLKDGNTYSAEAIYLHSFDTIPEVTDTILSKQNHDVYTVYNHLASEVILLIPPISLPLSRSQPLNKKENEQRQEDTWDIRFCWRNTAGKHESIFKSLRCGYNQRIPEPLFGALPPSMSKLQVGIYHDSQEKSFGWALLNQFDPQGGLSFQVSLQNNSTQSVNIDYYLDKLETLPKNLEVRVYNPQTGACQSCTPDKLAIISLPPGNRASRVIAIGEDNYFLNLFKPMALLKAFPNPFTRLINIHYRLPLGIKKVKFSFYNLQGKSLWQGLETHNINPGEHIFHFNTNMIPQANTLATGIYILRLTAQNADGKTIIGGKKRVFLIK